MWRAHGSLFESRARLKAESLLASPAATQHPEAPTVPHSGRRFGAYLNNFLLTLCLMLAHSAEEFIQLA